MDISCKFVIKQKLLECHCESDMSVLNGEPLKNQFFFFKELVHKFSITIFILL